MGRLFNLFVESCRNTKDSRAHNVKLKLKNCLRKKKREKTQKENLRSRRGVSSCISFHKSVNRREETRPSNSPRMSGFLSILPVIKRDFHVIRKTSTVTISDVNLYRSVPMLRSSECA